MERKGTGRAERTGVVEHDNNVVERDMDVCKAVTTLAGRALQGEDEIPLSMPSAPSRIAASKLASVFSGNVAEACGASQRRGEDDAGQEAARAEGGDP